MEKEKELFEKIQGQIADAVKDLNEKAREGMIDKPTFEAKLKEISSQVEEMNTKFADAGLKDEVQAQLDKLNEKFESLRLTEKQANNLVDLAVSEVKGLVDTYKEKGHKSSKEIAYKVATPEVFGLTTTTGAGIPLEDREPGLNYAPKRAPLMLDLILTGSTNSDVISWIEKTDEVGAPAFRKEFEEFPKRSWKTVVRNTLVKKIAVLAEYSKEILEDVDFFQAELRRDLVEQIQLVLDTNILRGEGGASDDQDLKGILEYAQAWTNGTFTVAKPSLYDVIAVGVNQIREQHHNPTVIVMRPKTAMRMKLTKDDNGNYVMPPFTAANGVSVEGLPVVTNTLLSDGEILIMDGTKAQFLWKRNWILELSDSHDDNFAKDILAVRLTGRGALKVKNTDAKAFVHVADVDDAITALTPSS